MKSDATTCESRDILSSRWRVFMLYWLPAIAIVAVGPLAISSGWRAVVWTVALATMGTACIVNALRCGRVHCYLTGPFFFLMASSRCRTSVRSPAYSQAIRRRLRVSICLCQLSRSPSMLASTFVVCTFISPVGSAVIPQVLSRNLCIPTNVSALSEARFRKSVKSGRGALRAFDRAV